MLNVQGISEFLWNSEILVIHGITGILEAMAVSGGVALPKEISIRIRKE